MSNHIWYFLSNNELRNTGYKDMYIILEWNKYLMYKTLPVHPQLLSAELLRSIVLILLCYVHILVTFVWVFCYLFLCQVFKHCMYLYLREILRRKSWLKSLGYSGVYDFLISSNFIIFRGDTIHVSARSVWEWTNEIEQIYVYSWTI